MKPLARDQRVCIAQTCFGLYLIGLAATESEIIDENCAMDNAGVPFYEEMLTEDMKYRLAQDKFDREFVGPRPHDPEFEKFLLKWKSPQAMFDQDLTLAAELLATAEAEKQKSN